MMQKKARVKVAASLTIHNVPGMSLRRRKDIIKWLRRIEHDMLKMPEMFAKTFRARYYYE